MMVIVFSYVFSLFYWWYFDPYVFWDIEHSLQTSVESENPSEGSMLYVHDTIIVLAFFLPHVSLEFLVVDR